MEASQATNVPAYAALVEEFGARVYSLALIITGSRELAVETTEAVFRQIRTRPEHLQDGGRTGIARLAHHHAVRRARAQPSTSTDSAATPSSSDPGTDRPPLLEHLSADEAAALEVTYFQGRTIKQAAEILDQPVPVMAARLRSALAAIHRTTAARRGQQAPVRGPLQRERWLAED